MRRGRLSNLRTRALTLVETLVVIALLLGLAALALPVLQTSKARAQKSACSQNLRQLYLATELYRADWGGGEV